MPSLHHINIIIIDNSSVNVLLISASIEGASHTYLHLSWLAKAYCVYMGVRLQWPLWQTAYLLYFCHCVYEGFGKERFLYVEFSVGSCFQVLEKHRYCVYRYSHKQLYILTNQGSVIHERAFSCTSSLVRMC